MPLLDKLAHRPAIDGLRAIAVLVVVLFHAGLGCPGGFIGVDVFFVISGFLITSLLWQDCESGAFSFGGFWERRARRIIPALVVMCVVTLLIGMVLLLPRDLDDLATSAMSQMVFSANVHFHGSLDYFSATADEQPLLHTWSLAVEEQFYLVMPIVLVGLFRIRMARKRLPVIGTLTILLVTSFCFSVYQVERRPADAFYLLPSRAWELLLGSLIVFIPVPAALQRVRSARDIIVSVALACIVIPVFAYDEGMAFPGVAALPPCLGAALILWLRTQPKDTPPAMTERLLSLRPLVFVGLISYSLYLWHWPLLAFANYVTITDLPLAERFALVGAGFALAVLSWKFVEAPFRERRLAASRRAMLVTAGAGLAITLGLGLVVAIADGFPRRYSQEILRLAAAKDDRPFTQVRLTTKDIQAERLVRFGVDDPSLSPSVLVWGDSHAMAALPAVDTLLRERGLSGCAAVRASTAPVLDWFARKRYGLNEKAVAFNAAVLEHLKARPIPDVILIANWSGYTTEEQDLSAFITALLTTIAEVKATGSRVWVMADVPTQPFNVPDALTRVGQSGVDLGPLCARPEDLDELEAADPDIVVKIVVSGGFLIDPKPMFLDPTGSFYAVTRDGVPLYRDRHHLTTPGARTMILPVLRNSLGLRLSVRQPDRTNGTSRPAPISGF